MRDQTGNSAVRCHSRLRASRARRIATLLTLLALAVASPAFAAKILWVSDAPGGPTVPDPAFSGPEPDPFMTDAGFIRLLQGAGHTVDRFDNPSASADLIPDADLARINTYDLVIIGRAALSGQFNRGTADTPLQGYQWTTGVTKPLICMSPYLVRPAMLGWFTGGTLPDNGVPAKPLATEPTSAVTDFVLAEVPMIGTEAVDGFDVITDRNTSFIQNDPVDGGRRILQSTVSTLGNVDNIVTVEMLTDFPSGTLVGDPAAPENQAPLAGYRMWMAGGSRESATGPQNEVSLYAGRENLSPVGESIFLRAVQVALMSGSAPAPAATLSLTRQPVSVTVAQGASARFDAAVAGPAPRTLQWQGSADGTTFTDIPGASTAFQTTAFVLPVVTSADNGARFRLVATSGASTVTSDVATLTVQADTAAPAIASVGTVNGATVDIYFSEPVDITSAALIDPANYRINGSSANVAAVTVRPDGRSVILTLAAPLTANSFTVSLSNIVDPFGNGIPAAGVTATGANLGLTSTGVGALNPLETSHAFFRGPASLEVVGGGLDLLHNATEFEDEFQFAHKTVTGDFDARVRVDSLTGDGRLEATAKAILSARDSVDPTSASFNVFVMPPAPGNDQIQATVRNFAGETTNRVGEIHSPAGLPAAVWLRITRTGESLTAYRSADGVQWTEIGKSDPALLPDVPDALEVGVGAASHINGNTVTAAFSNLSIQTGPVSNPIVISNLSVQGGSFSAAFQTQNGVTYNVEYKDSLSAAAWTQLVAVTGDGTLKTFNDPAPISARTARFYRVSRQ